MGKIKLLKEIHKCSSEELFDIIPQPDNQCPNVDRAIREIKDAQSEIDYLVRKNKGSEDIQEMYNDLKAALWRIECLDTPNELENLRIACSKIRDWGNEWKNLAKSLLEKSNIDDYLTLEMNIESNPSHH